MTCIFTKLLVTFFTIFALFSGPCITGERKEERGWIHKAPTKILHLVSWFQAIKCKTTLLYGSSERNQSSLFIWRGHMSTVIKPHACFIRALFHFSFQKLIPIQSGVWRIHKIPPPRPLFSLPGSPFGNKIIDRKSSFLSNTALCSIKTLLKNDQISLYLKSLDVKDHKVNLLRGWWGRRHTNLKDKPAGYRLDSDTDLMNQRYIIGSYSGLWNQRPWDKSPALSHQLCELIHSFFLCELGIRYAYFQGFSQGLKKITPGKCSHSGWPRVNSE